MSRQEVVALKRELLAFWPNNRYGHSTTAPTNEKLKEADDELEDRISRVLAMQRQHKEQLLHEMSPLAPRRPRSAVGRLSGQGSQSMLGGQAARTAGGRQWGDKMSQSLLEENTHSDSSEKQDICTELMTSSQKTSGSVSTHRSRRDNIMTRSVPDLPPSHTGYRSAGIPTPSYGHGHHSSSHNNINNTTSNNNISHNNALNSSGSNPAMTTSQASSSFMVEPATNRQCLRVECLLVFFVCIGEGPNAYLAYPVNALWSSALDALGQTAEMSAITSRSAADRKSFCHGKIKHGGLKVTITGRTLAVYGYLAYHHIQFLAAAAPVRLPKRPPFSLIALQHFIAAIRTRPRLRD
ncbi:type-2 histone deacetylase 1-like isoform X2 [Varroa jacobsoni]|uniref:type-2 histone deacetylase 1-like isoform X2 n=1 Tax=Varroa jacobsoni TaxID=62625 RepID=UPI000BF4E874|nr:type-2 histone deacetylase 1-like isoform X2 [Varroa jacobsoni]